MPGLVGRVIGGAGVVGAAYYQPMVLGGVGALTLLLVLGVVFPAVWSRDAKRRRAAATVLGLLLTALVGDRVATAVTAATSAGRGRKRDGSSSSGRPMAETGQDGFRSGDVGGEGGEGAGGVPLEDAAGVVVALVGTEVCLPDHVDPELPITPLNQCPNPA